MGLLSETLAAMTPEERDQLRALLGVTPAAPAQPPDVIVPPPPDADAVAELRAEVAELRAARTPTAARKPRPFSVPVGPLGGDRLAEAMRTGNHAYVAQIRKELGR